MVRNLREGLEARNVKQSAVDSCVFLRNNCVILVYVDDCIIISPEMKVIDAFVESMQTGSENFIVTDDGDLARFPGVEIDDKEDGSIERTQSHLIQRILVLCGLDSEKVNGRDDTPVGKPLLHKDLKGLPK